MTGQRILVVEDSALMRKHLRQIISEAGYQVETARNGQEGLDKVASFDPAVVTLDINMPVMDGITCLSMIMQRHPRPVVMVSSLTEKGALATFEALELGAVDYVSKPGGTVSLNIREVAKELLDKIKAASRAHIGKSRSLRQRLQEQRQQTKQRHQQPLSEQQELRAPRLRAKNSETAAKIVLVGVSTGGPGTVEEIITALPGYFPIPILIAQHMPARFTRVFAARLNKLTELDVIEVSHPQVLHPGGIFIAQGDADVRIMKRAGKLMACPVPASKEYLWHPSIGRMVKSAAQVFQPSEIICVELTGMGNDGAEAMTELHRQGARTIAESEETAVVYGMPRELVEQGGADYVLASHKIAKQLLKWVR